MTFEHPSTSSPHPIERKFNVNFSYINRSFLFLSICSVVEKTAVTWAYFDQGIVIY